MAPKVKSLVDEIEAASLEAEHANALLTLQRRLAKAERAAKESDQARKYAETLIERQQIQIEGLRGPRIELPAIRPRKSKAGDFCRVLIPDTHGAHVEPAAMGALLADLEVLRPTEIIFMGDHIDCGGFLAQHHTMGFVAETEYSFADDVNAANEMLDQVQRRAGKGARFDYLEGNHEHRIEKWCVTESLRNTKDAKFLKALLSPQAVLSLEKRAIKYASLYEFHDGLPVQGAIKRGKCHYVHGISHAKHAACETLSKFGGSVCFGHTHRVDSYVTTIVGPGLIGGWSFGCMCRLQPYYMHGRPSGHSNGYGCQLVSAEGEFITFQVPIVNGRSLLQPLFGAVVGCKP